MRLPIALGLALLAVGAAAQGVIVGRVTRIHDGDTVSVAQRDGQRLVRLASIDAPELAQPYGHQARQRLGTCRIGRIAVVEVQGTDRHGRMLGMLEAGGRDCGLDQLAAGTAWHYRHYADEQPTERRLAYAAAERAARQRGAGLWAEPDPIPPWTYRRLNPPPRREP